MVNLKGWMMILELHQQGLTVSAIAERTGHDRKTVRKVIERGLVVPKYASRTARPTLLGPYEIYLRERVAAWPELSGVRLLRELRERGYAGGVTQLNDFLRVVRPPVVAPFEVRFETPAGRQAQVDFAHFMAEFTERPGVQHRVWLFAIVLGHSRYLWGQYVLHQDLGTVLRCHMLAFEHFGGTPHEILYDRMKTAVLGETADDTGIVYNAKLIGLGAHYGFKPRACKAYRAKTKGKIERPFRYVRANFFLARSFANLEDLNRQLRVWLDTVANALLHGSTGRVVAEHFAAERQPEGAAGRPLRRCAAHRATRQPRGHGLGGRQPLQRARRHHQARTGGGDDRRLRAHPRRPSAGGSACAAARAAPALAAAGASSGAPSCDGFRGAAAPGGAASRA